MRANPFESQLERLARTLTEQFGVKVVCQGDNAWTDGRRIVLPSLPEPLSDSLERMMVGYLDHEMAHVAFSDFKMAEQFAKKHPGFEGMLNVVEDALIERRAMQRWPGVRANLDSMFRQIQPRVQQLIQQRSPFDRFCTAVYLRLAHHNDLMGLGSELAGYDDLLDSFATVKDTRDAAALAEGLLKRWLKRNPPKPTPTRKDQRKDESQKNQRGSAGRSSSPSSGNEGAASSSGAGSSEPEDSEADADDSSDSQQADQDSQGSGKANGGAEEPQKQGDSEPSGNTSPASTAESEGQQAQGARAAGFHGGSLISEALTEAIAESVAGCGNATQYRPFTKQYDHIDVPRAAPDSEVQVLLQTGTDVVRRLRRGLANALRSAEKRWWRDDQVRGNLSPRTLYRLSTDRARLDVFRVRSAVQGRSTAVSAVLDASGSMHSRKMDVARQAMRVLLEALADLKIATEAFTFTTGDRFNLSKACQVTGQSPVQLQDRFSRFGNLEIGLIKRFEEPVNTALKRLPGIRGTGLTPLGEAMQIGASRLLPRPESRRIILVLTDGRAGCECGDGSSQLHAQHIASLCRKAGIELIGVGIQDESLRQIVADAIVIHELQELPAQLCKLLGRTLTKGVCHVG